jgi:hypothetical protein
MRRVASATVNLGKEGSRLRRVATRLAHDRTVLFFVEHGRLIKKPVLAASRGTRVLGAAATGSGWAGVGRCLIEPVAAWGQGPDGLGRRGKRADASPFLEG